MTNLLQKFLRHLNRVYDAIIPSRYRFQNYFNKYISNKIGRKVVSGPFKGMLYDGNYLPYKLGTYEKELHYEIENLLNNDFDIIINIGGNQGYYAIGFSMFNHISKIVVFEPNIFQNRNIFRLAKLNNVDKKLIIKSLCDLNTLRNSIQHYEKKCVFIDVDGSEIYLLDPINCPELKDTYIVVETHNFVFPGYDINQELINRFENTHKINKINQRIRNISDFPIKMTFLLNILFYRQLINSMCELRPSDNEWLILEPKYY